MIIVMKWEKLSSSRFNELFKLAFFVKQVMGATKVNIRLGLVKVRL